MVGGYVRMWDGRWEIGGRSVCKDVGW
jgi:hypothetical protein